MADAVHRGSRAALMDRLRELPGMLAGRVSDPSGAVDAMMTAVGVEALSIIREAYIEKARGGTDEAGLSWQKLSPRTIAYGRRHGATLARKRKAAAKAGRPGRPLLTAAQDRLWKGVFASTARRLTLAGEKNANANAAALAWRLVKAAGGKTILSEYGGTKVEILRDTGRLLASLSPGTPDNILRVGPGEVSVGTNVVYARTHHEGRGKVPARPLWPELDSWPQAWWDRLEEVVADGVAGMVRRAVGGG